MGEQRRYVFQLEQSQTASTTGLGAVNFQAMVSNNVRTASNANSQENSFSPLLIYIMTLQLKFEVKDALAE